MDGLICRHSSFRSQQNQMAIAPWSARANSEITDRINEINEVANLPRRTGFTPGTNEDDSKVSVANEKKKVSIWRVIRHIIDCQEMPDAKFSVDHLSDVRDRTCIYFIHISLFKKLHKKTKKKGEKKVRSLFSTGLLRNRKRERGKIDHDIFEWTTYHFVILCPCLKQLFKLIIYITIRNKRNDKYINVKKI